jgi:predicted anti-sigma-YlaC factor YlaD
MTDVDCLTCREALSARMDGEDEPVPTEQTDRHLTSCADCRAWQARVEHQSRMLRIRQAPPVPDLSAAILDMAAPPQETRGWWARIALIAVATAQLALAMSQLIGVHLTVGASTHGDGHLFNESTAWNFALGAALLWAAFRSRVTSGLIPVIAGFVLVLAPYSVHDMVTGAVGTSRVAEHGLLVVALALLIVINRRYGDPAPRHGSALDEDTDTTTRADTEETGAPAPGTAPHPLRPTGHHAA